MIWQWPIVQSFIHQHIIISFPFAKAPLASTIANKVNIGLWSFRSAFSHCCYSKTILLLKISQVLLFYKTHQDKYRVLPRILIKHALGQLLNFKTFPKPSHNVVRHNLSKLYQIVLYNNFNNFMPSFLSIQHNVLLL